MPYGSIYSDVVQGSTAATAPVFNDGNGTQIGQLTKSWCNYSTTTPTNNGSFNVSSLVKNTTGDITFSFTTALASSVFSYGDGGYNTGSGEGSWNPIKSATAPTASAFRVQCYNSAGSAQEQPYAYFAIFR